jgi:DNA polymerase III alpha subunit
VRELHALGETGEIVLAGMIAGLRSTVIKNGRNAGQRMARFRLEDLHGGVNATVFARQYADLKNQIQDDALVFVRARIDRSGDDPAILVDDAEDAPTYVRRNVDALVLRLRAGQHPPEVVARAAELVRSSPGPHRLLVEIVDEDGEKLTLAADASFRVELSDGLIDGLAALVGSEQLSFTRK